MNIYDQQDGDDSCEAAITEADSDAMFMLKIHKNNQSSRCTRCAY